MAEASTPEASTPEISPAIRPVALAALLQLTDSAVPIGRYVHSHGLESWLAAHPDAALELLCDVVWAAVDAVATLDAVVLRLALEATRVTDVIGLDHSLWQAKPAAEARLAAQTCGRQLAALGIALGPHDPVTEAYLTAVPAGRTPGTVAAVEARLLAAAGACAADAVAAVLYSSAAALFTVAVRLGRLGPRAAQVMLWQGRERLAHCTATSLGTNLADVHGSAVELEIHLMRHRRRSGNLFRT